MIVIVFFLIFYYSLSNAMHFNGGTIRWEPVTTYPNNITSINIIQTYSWTYPTIQCANNVPISTSGRSGENRSLICMSDCSTDGGYSTKQITALTDCQSFSSSLGMMTSQRSVNINLTTGAHFYISHIGAAWLPLSYPPKSGLQWSITALIDLRLRPDGIINTPPTASVISPQYAIVNQTTQITIPVSDVNAGDTVRCRWSTYTVGYRRRRLYDEESNYYLYRAEINKKSSFQNEIIYNQRIKRASDPCKDCDIMCQKDCLCSCASCNGTTCSGSKCINKAGCQVATTTVKITTVKTTTSETPGTIKTTSSFPNRQAVDECGGICFPGSVPSGTSLSGCTISFVGLVPDTWYAVAIQVEDFINSSSTEAMSSVPVQLLIYVMDQPTCGLAPVIFPLTRCLDVQVGVSISFNISAMTRCDPDVSDIDTIFVSLDIIGMNSSDTIESTTNSSVSYNTFTWKPTASQIGSQILCVIAFSEEIIQSDQYCVTFNVVNSSLICTTTTTTTTSTSFTSTSTTSQSTTSRSTTTISSSTSMSTTSISISTTKTTTQLSVTLLSNVSTIIMTTTKSSSDDVKDIDIGLILIVILSSLFFLIAVYSCCYCFYWLCGSTVRYDQNTEIEQNKLFIRTFHMRK